MIFDFLKKRRARIEAKKESLKLLDENTAKIVANLIRIAVIERDKEARFAVWESEIVAWLNEIYSKCENLNSSISPTSYTRKRLRFKDYVYVLRYLRIGAKHDLENEGLENTWESVNLDGLTIKEQREKILAMYRIKPKEIKIRKWEHKELHEVIYNLLKWEFKEMVNGYGFYFGIDDKNPYYQKILGNSTNLIRDKL